MNDPKIEDLCPYHDLGIDVAECSGPWECQCEAMVPCGSLCPECTLPVKGINP